LPVEPIDPTFRAFAISLLHSQRGETSSLGLWFRDQAIANSRIGLS
jgi:hypothetical protein